MSSPSTTSLADTALVQTFRKWFVGLSLEQKRMALTFQDETFVNQLVNMEKQQRKCGRGYFSPKPPSGLCLSHCLTSQHCISSLPHTPLAILDTPLTEILLGICL